MELLLVGRHNMQVCLHFSHVGRKFWCQGANHTSIHGEEATELFTLKDNWTGYPKYSTHGMVIQLQLTIAF